MLTVFTSEGFIMYKRCDRSLKLDHGAMPDYTMCKISHFARKMGGQNFHKFNAVITSRDYI